MSTTRYTPELISQLNLIRKLVQKVFPQVEVELDGWRDRIKTCPDEVLATQALASISTKRFHAQGGSVYALYPGVEQQGFIRFVVAFQTISDYLDNLCDRAGVAEEAAFRQLHLAFEEALSVDGPISEYYCFYPHGEDGGYLAGLVQECRQQLSRWPAYSVVQHEVIRLARLYSQLQTYKHLSREVREEKLRLWAQPHLEIMAGLSCWEFAAATGSTLGIFVLCAMSSNPNLKVEEVEKVIGAYFPWVCGLHILLDYFIDQQEDREGGDLNFVFYYADSVVCQQRLTWFLETALQQISHLEYSLFHQTVLIGLLAMYLSDPKAAQEEVGDISSSLLSTGGRRARMFHNFCKVLRWRKRI
jgi:tetraprenyl-beta-curcumene synthase